MTSLPDMMERLHRDLAAAGVPHAFGGALALAWCVEEARSTQDVDLNLFVGPDVAARVLAALPSEVEITEQNRADIARDGQARLRWDDIPIDVFFANTLFHEEAA